MTATGNNSGKLTRSRYGCFSCRKRKKRCDQKKPSCQACERLELECQYPEPGKERKNRPRRPKSQLYDGDMDSRSDKSHDHELEHEHEHDQNQDHVGTTQSQHQNHERLAIENPFMVYPSLVKPALSISHDSFEKQEPLAFSAKQALNTRVPSVSLDHALALFQQGTTSELSDRKRFKELFENDEAGVDAGANVDVAVAVDPVVAVDAVDAVNAINAVDADSAVSAGTSNNSSNPQGSSPPMSPGISAIIEEILRSDSTEVGHVKGSPGFSPSLFDYHEHLADLMSPIPALTPPSLAKLEPQASSLFQYFQESLARLINVGGPVNSFLNVFVPMAHESEPVLNALVAWSGFHKGKGQDQQIGYKYLNKAIEGVVANYHTYDNTILAALLLICSGEICSGDVVHWHQHLNLAAKLIKLSGGLRRFYNDKSLTWLASNFCYHDLLAASTCSRNPHFSPEEYNQLFTHGEVAGPDSLIGCCQPLFQILAEISSLAVETQQIYKSESGGNLVRLQSISARALAMEQKIENCSPQNLNHIMLTPEELEQQMTLFETLQYTAKLHLFQSVLRINSRALQMQCLHKELCNSLDVVLNTGVEGLLVFPLFIAGLSCCHAAQRVGIIQRFDSFYERNKARNIRRAKQLLEEVWMRDKHGSMHVDWYSIIGSRGWDINFA